MPKAPKKGRAKTKKGRAKPKTGVKSKMGAKPLSKEQKKQKDNKDQAEREDYFKSHSTVK